MIVRRVEHHTPDNRKAATKGRRKNGIEPGSRSRRIAESEETHYGLPSEKARYEARTDREVEPAGRNGTSPCPHLCPLRERGMENLGPFRGGPEDLGQARPLPVELSSFRRTDAEPGNLMGVSLPGIVV